MSLDGGRPNDVGTHSLSGRQPAPAPGQTPRGLKRYRQIGDEMRAAGMLRQERPRGEDYYLAADVDALYGVLLHLLRRIVEESHDANARKLASEAIRELESR